MSLPPDFATAKLRQAARLLSTAPPDVDAAAAAELMAQHYGIDAAVRPLSGERDRNFLVEDAE